MRTNKIMNLLCMAVLCAAAMAVSSCSDDSPGTGGIQAEAR